MPEVKQFVSAVIENEQGKYLAQFHPKKTGEKWRLPGGKIEPGEQSIIAIARELEEEIGVVPISLVLVEITEPHQVDSGVWQGYIYFARVKGEPLLKEPDKVTELRYLSGKEFADLGSPVAAGIIERFELKAYEWLS